MIANADMIEELKWESRGIFFDEMPVYQAREDDLDKEKIKHFLLSRRSADVEKNLKTKKKIVDAVLEEAMYSYKIMTKEHGHAYPTVLGILLFGKDPQFFFSEARIMCNHFSGIAMSPSVVASKECLGTLDEQFQTAYNFVMSRLNRVWEIKGPRREEQLEIPQQAIREMIMNSIIHRNYHIPGPNKIAIFDNRIEIFSQGSFPAPVGKNLRAGFTYLRNTMICKIFREMGLIENFGFGFIFTFSSYEKAGLKDPEIIEGENFIKCILPRRTQSNVRSLSTTEPIISQKILNLLETTSEISVSDVMNMVHLTRQTATRKLAELVKKKLLVRHGKGRGVKYSKD